MTSTSSVVSGFGESVAPAIETSLLTASAIRRPGWRKKSKPQRWWRLSPKKRRKARKERNCATISDMFKLLTAYNTANDDVREELWMEIHFLLIESPLHAAVALIVKMCPGLLFSGTVDQSSGNMHPIVLKTMFIERVRKINSSDARKALKLADDKGVAVALDLFNVQVVSTVEEFWRLHRYNWMKRNFIIKRSSKTGLTYYNFLATNVVVVYGHFETAPDGSLSIAVFEEDSTDDGLGWVHADSDSDDNDQ